MLDTGCTSILCPHQDTKHSNIGIAAIPGSQTGSQRPQLPTPGHSQSLRLRRNGTSGHIQHYQGTFRKCLLSSRSRVRVAVGAQVRGLESRQGRGGFGDASSLAERVVFFTQPDDRGWVHLLPVQRRVSYAHGSAAAAWLHPVGAVTDDEECPCGSAGPYSACHGGKITSGDPSPAS